MNKSARFSQDLVYRIYTHPSRQSEGGKTWRRKGSRIGFLIQMYKREIKYKSDWDDLEIVQEPTNMLPTFLIT
jgi:hypothetical protein